MADLEDLGLLAQPHTSAGRIPTDLGYRYYVDYLMEMQALSEKEKLEIEQQLTTASSLTPCFGKRRDCWEKYQNS